MANGDQTGGEAFRGANPIGAYYAGRGTPVSSGLTPEGERLAKLQLIQALNETAKLEQEIQLRGITSYSNIAVTYTNAISNAVQAAVNMARIGQMENAQLQNVLLELEKMRGTFVSVLGQNYDEGTNSLLVQGSSAVKTDSERNGATLLKRNPQLDNSQKFYNAMQGEVIKNVRALMVDPTLTAMDNLDRGPVATRVDTKTKSLSEMSEAAGKAFDNYIFGLPSNSPIRRQLMGTDASGLTVRQRFQANVVREAIKGNEDRYNSSDADMKAAQLERDTSNVRLAALEEKFESMSAGVSPGLQKAFGEVIELNREIVAGGPEAFIDRAGKSPTPVALQLNKQRLEQEIREIDDPTDPYSQAVGRFAAAVPYFENYMTVMGFDNVEQAAKYLHKRPEESLEWIKIVKMMGDADEIERMDDIPMLQERMRVAGSSGERGTGSFRKQFLTKPVERLLGIGINRPPLWKYFSGTTTQTQLDAAIDALAKEENPGDTEQQLFGMETTPQEITLNEQMKQGEVGVEDVIAERFAMGFEGKERDRLEAKAEKFKERIDPTETAKTRFERREERRKDRQDRDQRFVLPGYDGQPVIEEEPAVVAQEPPPPRQPLNVGIGGASKGERLGNIRERISGAGAAVGQGLANIVTPNKSQPKPDTGSGPLNLEQITVQDAINRGLLTEEQAIERGLIKKPTVKSETNTDSTQTNLPVNSKQINVTVSVPREELNKEQAAALGYVQDQDGNWSRPLVRDTGTTQVEDEDSALVKELESVNQDSNESIDTGDNSEIIEIMADDSQIENKFPSTNNETKKQAADDTNSAPKPASEPKGMYAKEALRKGLPFWVSRKGTKDR